MGGHGGRNARGRSLRSPSPLPEQVYEGQYASDNGGQLCSEIHLDAILPCSEVGGYWAIICLTGCLASVSFRHRLEG